MAHLFDKHGVIVNHPTEDGYHTVTQIVDLLDLAFSIPRIDRDEFLDAVNVHYRNYYDGIDAGQYQLRRKPGGKFLHFWRGYDLDGVYLDGLGT